MPVQIWLWMLGAGFLTWVLVGFVRSYALKNNVVDIPGGRSSHIVPTPRGGGVAIVGVLLGFAVLLYSFSYINLPVMLALLFSGGLVAAIGFWDDHSHIPAQWRLCGHFIAGVLALYQLNGLPPLTFFGVQIDLGLFGNFLALIFIVWTINLYNFMDGINGIASIEAISICIGGIILYLLLGYREPVILLLVLAASASGFLIWNFPSAKIFMGDSGSGFLGFSIAFLSLHATSIHSNLLWSWLILLGVFAVDSTFTLLRRLIRGDRVYEAHRTHAYQYASRYYGSHKVVSIFVGVINLLWLLPWAVSVTLGLIDGILAVCFAYAPLVLLAVKYNAGAREQAS